MTGNNNNDNESEPITNIPAADLVYVIKSIRYIEPMYEEKPFNTYEWHIDDNDNKIIDSGEVTLPSVVIVLEKFYELKTTNDESRRDNEDPLSQYTNMENYVEKLMRVQNQRMQGPRYAQRTPIVLDVLTYRKLKLFVGNKVVLSMMNLDSIIENDRKITQQENEQDRFL